MDSDDVDVITFWFKHETSNNLEIESLPAYTHLLYVQINT